MRSFLRNIDKFFGRILVFFFFLLKKSKVNKLKIDKILIVKLWAIGDSVISLSLVRAIKDSFPDSKINVLTTRSVSDIFRYGGADKIIKIDSIINLCKLLFSLNKYDLVFDCEPYFNLSAIFSYYLGKRSVGFAEQYRSRLFTDKVKFRKDQHMVQNYLDMLRKLNVECDVDNLEKITIPNFELHRVKEFISSKLNTVKIVGICAGISGAVKSRMWYEDRFAELADKVVQELGMQVVFVDSIKSNHTVETIRKMMSEDSVSTVGELSLKEELFLISKCDVFISNDTGPMHIAAAQGCKTIGLFGPNTPVLWAPYGKGNLSIYKTKLPPSIQNDKGVFEDRNREAYMGPISVDDVFDAVKGIKI